VTTTYPIPGAILAGGKSRRMGEDKALLQIGGKPLIGRIANVLQDVCSEVIIVGGESSKFASVGVRWIPDVVTNQGPLGGIQSALMHLKTDTVISACDLPSITPDLIRFLLSRHDILQSQITVARSERTIQPLLGVYSSSCLSQLNAFLGFGGRKVGEFLDMCQVTYVPLQAAFPPFPDDLLFNLNFPIDSALLKQNLS